MAENEAGYRSGNAARIAGLPVATLRVWERRYGLGGMRPGGAGHRRYSAEDVERLALLKRLVDAGHAIGAIARLPIARLRAMQAPQVSRAQPEGAARLRVALVGDFDVAEGAALEIVARCADAATAARDLAGVEADLAAVSLPTLHEEEVAVVDALCRAVRARGAIVAYRFGTDAQVAALRGRGHVVARAPLARGQLEALAASLPAGERTAPWPEPTLHPARFDEPTLARLARATGLLACECPQHLVELVRQLAAFERYSAECAHRNPADARLHDELQRLASTSRALIEEALARVAAADGLA